MHRFVPIFCALLVALAVAQTTYEGLPGSDDAEKISLIRGAIARLRQYVAGQACFTEAFPNPTDEDAIERWAAWICSYLGGPSDSNPNCTWFSQFGDNTTVVTDRDELLLELILKHTSVPITTEGSTLFTQLLAKALLSVGTPSGIDEDDVIEAFGNVTDSLVNTAGACRVADLTIPWTNPGTHNDNVVLNGLVSWVWDDALEHSIKVNTGEAAVLVGFGSGDLTLFRNSACTSTGVSFPDGGPPCNLAGTGNFSYSHVFPADDTINYHCGIHFSTLTGVLVVGDGGSSSNTNTNTQPADITDTDGGDGNDGGDGSAATTLKAGFTLF